MSTPAQTNPASVSLLTVQVGSITGIASRFLFLLWLAQPKPDEESNINTGYQLMVPTSVLLLHLALKLARTRRITFSGGQPIHICLGMITCLHGILSTSNVSPIGLFFVYLCIPVLILYLQIRISNNSNKLPDLSMSRERTPLLAPQSSPSSNSSSHDSATRPDSPTSVVNSGALRPPQSLPSRNIIGRYACHGFIASFFITALAAGLEEYLRATGSSLLARITIPTIIFILSGGVFANRMFNALAIDRVNPKEIYFTAPVLAGIFSAAGLITTIISHIVNNNNNMMLQFLGTYVAATATTLVSIQNPRDTNLQELQIPTCSRSPSL